MLLKITFNDLLTLGNTYKMKNENERIPQYYQDYNVI
jgi:hypothetical protein